jgi:hypothetical protein
MISVECKESFAMSRLAPERKVSISVTVGGLCITKQRCKEEMACRPNLLISRVRNGFSVDVVESLDAFNTNWS